MRSFLNTASVFIVGSSLALASACNGDKQSARRMPVAKSWSAATPMPSQLGASSGGGDPHGNRGGMGGDPHAGMNIPGMGGPGMGGDPHAGMNIPGMGGPGMGGDPHAGMNIPGMGGPGMGGDPHAGMNIPGMGGPGMGEDPAMAAVQPPDPARPIDKSRFLRGTIAATAKTKKNIPAGSILFLSVKPYDPATGDVLGGPLAVERIDIGKLPVSFELTEEHAMAAGTELVGDVIITARVDQDGEARSAQPGDVEGRVVARIPARNLKLTLDTVVQ